MDINSTAPSLRETLLGRNIISDSVSENGLSGLLVGIGDFVSIGHNTPNVQPSENLELLADLYKDLLIVNNKHQGELYDYRKISIVNNSQNVGANLTVYGQNHADLIDNNELYNDLNIINNKYKSVLGQQVIDVKLTNPLTPSDGQYDFADAKLGLDESSEEFRKKNVIKSKYLDFDSQLLKDIVTTPIVTDKNETNYYDYMKGFGDNNGSVTSTASSIINGILGGILPNGRTSEPNPLFGLGGSNLNAPDSALGVLAAQGLGNAIQANIGANLYEETLGNINTNPLSLMMGNDIIVPNYSITVAKGTTGGLLDYAEKILGFQVPVSLLSQSSSIFQSENPIPNVDRANNMIENTGRGQIMSLFANLQASLLSSNDVKSGYAPGFVDKRDPNGGINANIYAFADGRGGVIDLLNGEDNNPMSQSNYNDGLAAASGFKGLENVTSNQYTTLNYTLGKDFQWDNPLTAVYADSQDFDKKSLLAKTQNLFRNADKMVNLMTDKFAKAKQGETNTTISSDGLPVGEGYISKGSAVRQFNGNLPETDPEKMFARAWTTFDKYDSVEDLQKHSGLIQNAGVNERYNTVGSVLDDNGFVKIAPNDDSEGFKYADSNLKNYMFSIENLAWADVAESGLIPSEIGPGDTTTGKKGRIMWFPPYEMNFTDNTSVNWDSIDFIGRGEPVYTYNNTTRIGTLQFKIIIDHPSYMNNLRGESDELIDAFFAGSWQTDDRIRSKFSVNELNDMELALNQQIKEVNSTPTTMPSDFSVYYPYNSVSIDEVNLDYENSANFNFVTNPWGLDEGVGTYLDADAITRIDNTNYGLNDKYWEAIADLPDTLKDCTGCKVTITTYGITGENSQARTRRQETIFDYLVASNTPSDPVLLDRYKMVDGGETAVPLVGTNGIPLPTAMRTIKENVKVNVTFEWDAKLAEKINPKPANLINKMNKLKKQLGDKHKEKFYNESLFFNKLKEDDKFVYDSISKKIAFFHPSFHSITPEGFNSRLTFLQQCTRQGPTFTGNEDRPDNLAFGRPPVCILRIGDFYHTKIVIDNLSLSYEPLVWDLNPEGVGVQPMICTVDMQFAFIGGSSLRGPINKLQNAVSFNYFANTEIYDPRADKIKTNKNPDTDSIVIAGTYPDESGKLGGTNDDGTPASNTIVPVTNQADQADAAVGPTQPPVAPTVEDGKRLAIISAAWSGTFEDPILTIQFGRKVGDDGSPLTKDYDLRISNKSSNGMGAKVPYHKVGYLSTNTTFTYVLDATKELIGGYSDSIPNYPYDRTNLTIELDGTSYKYNAVITVPSQFNPTPISNLGPTPMINF